MSNMTDYRKTTGLDPQGNSVDLYLKNGQSFTSDGNRIGEGWTVNTGGGTYRMGADGRGVKVQTPNPNRQFKSTTGFDPSGRMHNLYLDNGQGYTQDGNRIGQGWTINTGGGIFQMGADGRGHQVQQHNRAKPDYSALQSYLDTQKDQFTYNRQDWSQKGADRYKPIFDSQMQALTSERDSAIQGLQSQIGGVDLEYDRAVEAQERQALQAKNNYDKQMAARGVGRSSIASTGMAEIDNVNARLTQDINRERAQSITSIQGKIQNLKESFGSKISNLESNRVIMEQQMADELEGRHFDMWYKQAGLNQGQSKLQYDLLAKQAEQEFQMNLSDWERSREMTDQLGALGWGGGRAQGNLLRQLQEREADRLDEKEYRKGQDRLAARFQEGTPEYELNKLMQQDNLSQQEAMMKLQQKYAQSYGGGGGGGYSRSYGGGGGGYSSGGGGSNKYVGSNPTASGLINNSWAEFSNIYTNPGLSPQQKKNQVGTLHKLITQDPEYQLLSDSDKSKIKQSYATTLKNIDNSAGVYAPSKVGKSSSSSKSTSSTKKASTNTTKAKSTTSNWMKEAQKRALEKSKSASGRRK